MIPITRLLVQTTEEKGLANDLSLTALRAFAGLSMALAHGLGKIPPSEKFLESVAALGFPAPEFFARAAGYAEFYGGLLLAAGLLTRPASLFIAFTMIVAVFGRHAGDPYGKMELGLLYLAITLVFAVRGAGKLSLDHLLTRVLRHRPAPAPETAQEAA